MKRAIAVASLMAAASSASASGSYIGLDYTRFDMELIGGQTRLEANPEVINLQLGYWLNDYIAIESNFGLGSSEDNVENSNFNPIVPDVGLDVDLDIESSYGASLLFSTSVQYNLHFFAKIGYANFEFESSANEEGDADGFAWGIGFGYNQANSVGWKLAFNVLPDGRFDDFDVDVESESFNFSIFYQF